MASTETVSSFSLNQISSFSVFQLDGADVDENEDSSDFHSESKLYRFGVFFAEYYLSSIGRKAKNYSITYSIRAPPA